MQVECWCRALQYFSVGNVVLDFIVRGHLPRASLLAENFFLSFFGGVGEGSDVVLHHLMV
jgi:hypothetical protein